MTTPDHRDDQARIPQQAGSEPSGPIVTEEAPTAPKRRRRWWIAAAAVAVLAAAGGAVYALLPNDEDRAVDRCQQSVTAKLRSPSSASYGKVTVVAEDGKFATYYKVFGTVDAQNAFGATIRGVYRCEVNRENNGDWLVTSTEIV